MHARSGLSAAVLLVFCAGEAAAGSAGEPDALRRSFAIDTRNARVEFDIAALWIVHRRGSFSDIDGSLQISADGGSAEIKVRIGAASVRMKDQKDAELLLSPAFFDAAHHPSIEFRSDAFAWLGNRHMALPGTLTVRGISRRVRFDVDLGNCQPGLPAPCTVAVEGVLQRSRFGMTEYRRTLSDKVYLKIAAELGASGAEGEHEH